MKMLTWRTKSLEFRGLSNLNVTLIFSKETHEELAIATSVNPMQPGDKALVKIEGDFKEKGQRNEQEKPTLV